MSSAWIFLHKLYAGNTTANWTIKQAYALWKTLILSPKIEIKTKKYQNLEVFSNGIQLELFNTIPKQEILQQKEVSSSILILNSKIEKKKKKNTKKCQNLACILI